MNELALFAGAGGGLLASKILGWHTIGAVEINPYCQEVLLQRQRDGWLEEFPLFGDVRSFDGSPWRGLVDVISGGFPCQDVSQAGKGLGVRSGEHSGLWKEFARIIEEVQPTFAFVENVPLLTSRGLDIVLCDLAAMGYDARWCCLGAREFGAFHNRQRLFLLAYSNEVRRESSYMHAEVWQRCANRAWWESGQKKDEGWLSLYAGLEQAVHAFNRKPDAARSPRVLDGMADFLDRIEAVGNGQYPRCAAAAFLILSQGLEVPE